MIPLAACSIVALAVILERAWVWRRLGRSHDPETLLARAAGRPISSTHRRRRVSPRRVSTVPWRPRRFLRCRLRSSAAQPARGGCSTRGKGAGTRRERGARGLAADGADLLRTQCARRQRACLHARQRAAWRWQDVVQPRGGAPPAGRSDGRQAALTRASQHAEVREQATRELDKLRAAGPSTNW